MAQIISKEELEKIKNLKGEARGMGIKSNIDFVLEKEGKETLEKIEKNLEEIGFPLKYKQIKPMDFYPMSWEAGLLLIINKLFGYDEMKFREMGMFGAKSSLLIRLFMKYFVSIDKIIDKPPEMWRKYFTTGKLSLEKFDQEKKLIILKLEDFKLIRFHCQLLLGFISSLIEMMVKSKVNAEEINCPFKGAEFHEFRITWS